MDFTHISASYPKWYEAPNRLSTPGTQSPIEEKLVGALQRFSVFPATQFKIGRCTVDICLPDDKIVIECDGAAYHTDKEKDQRRDDFITKQGYRVLRYTGSEITRDPVSVASQIICHMAGENPEHTKYLNKLDEQLKAEEEYWDQQLYSDKF